MFAYPNEYLGTFSATRIAQDDILTAHQNPAVKKLVSELGNTIVALSL